jgi:hypothetical protein
MDKPSDRDWLGESKRHDITMVCEQALRAASGIIWQQLGFIAAGGMSRIGADYFDPSRAVIAEYLRHTGRLQEAQEVEAIGCNEPPPRTGFVRLTPAALADLRRTMEG